MRRTRSRPALLAALALCSALLVGCAPRLVVPPTPAPTTPPAAAATAAPPSVASTLTFAVIGDYGWGSKNEAAVAKLVASWRPEFIITTGDDYYASAGGTGTGRYDRSTGAFYCAWLKGVSTTGSACRIGQASRNAFFPCLGNHDYSDARPSPKTYLTYFKLPGAGFHSTSGNERYYDFVEGPIHFFVLDSNPGEPSGTRSTSTQAKWLKRGLAASTSTWNVVYDHHPPYSSDRVHGSTTSMRWPFASWGADVVLSGHAHTYERVMRSGIPYFVNGLGGAPRYAFKAAIPGSVVRYRADWGAQKVTVGGTTMTFEFYNVHGALEDRYVLAAD